MHFFELELHIQNHEKILTKVVSDYAYTYTCWRASHRVTDLDAIPFANILNKKKYTYGYKRGCDDL